MRFQLRHGFYTAYAVLSVMYIILIRLLPDTLAGPALTLILFSDICALGFFFIGAIILLERGQNITQSLFVTPLRLSEYLLAKQISFLILSLMSAFLIVLGVSAFKGDVLWFSYGLIMSSSVYTLFGVYFAAKARHVNDYFVRALGIGLFISLPVVAYLNLFDTVLFNVFPTHATLILLDVLEHNYSGSEKIYAGLNLLTWVIVLSFFAWQRLEKHVRHPA